ncbi:MAG: hypothetical protein GY839_21640 [candidate division Zixibacteria bacterium]|nr:hypothetical protein [candidate division Zixibacteria bacterium]
MILIVIIMMACVFSCSEDKVVNEEPATLNFTNQYPADGADSIPLFTRFSWEHENPTGIVNYYDLYLGTNSNPPLVHPDIFETNYYPFKLHDSTTYFWRIVVRDRDQNEYTGPTWSFSALNGPPTQPANPIPPADTTVPPAPIELQWESSELDDEAMEFDVYFGTEANPPLFESNRTSMVININDLENHTDYFWKIVARDESGHETTGDIWQFTAENFAPTAPSNPFPANNATGIGIDFTFSWLSEDTEDDAISYDLYLGTEIDPPLEMNNLTINNLFSPWRKVALAEQTLQAIYDAQIEWRTTGHGTYTLNGVTASSANPNGFNTIGVTIDSTDVYSYVMTATTNTFTCTATANIDHDVHVDTRTIDQTGELTNTINDLNTPFEASSTYYWKIIAWDTYDDSTVGPVWQFTTGTE